MCERDGICTGGRWKDVEKAERFGNSLSHKGECKRREGSQRYTERCRGEERGKREPGTLHTSGGE